MVTSFIESDKRKRLLEDQGRDSLTIDECNY